MLNIAAVAAVTGDLLIAHPEWGNTPSEGLTVEEVRAAVEEAQEALQALVPLIKDRVRRGYEKGDAATGRLSRLRGRRQR